MSKSSKYSLVHVFPFISVSWVWFSRPYYRHFAYFHIKNACPDLATDPSCLIWGSFLTESKNKELLFLENFETALTFQSRNTQNHRPKLKGSSWAFSEGQNFIISHLVSRDGSTRMGEGMNPQTDNFLSIRLDREEWRKTGNEFLQKSLTPSKTSKSQRPVALSYILTSLYKCVFPMNSLKDNTP